MLGRSAFVLTGALLTALLAAPAATSVAVPDCPTLAVGDGAYVQCATIPGAMVSALELECVVCSWEIRLVGVPTGSVEIDLGWFVHSCSFENGVGPCNGLGWAWCCAFEVTSTIRLTNGVGAVLVRWDAA